MFQLQQLLLGPQIAPLWIYMGYLSVTAASLVAAAVLIGLSPAVGIFAAWIVAIFSMPLFWGMPTFPMFIIAPQYFEWVLAFLWLTLGFLFLPNISSLVSVMFGCAVGTYLAYLCVLIPQSIAVLLPPLGVACVLLTALSRGRREFLLKSLVLACTGAILVMAGVFQYAAAIASFNPAAFFLKEIPPYQSGLASASIIYAWQRYPAGAVLSVVSGIGATAYALIRRHALRTNPIAQCALVTATLTLGIWALGPALRLVDAYLLALPVIYTLRFLYFEFPILPATALTASAIAISAVSAAGGWVERQVGQPGLVISAHALILGVAGLVLARFAVDGELAGYNPYLPTRDTEITRILQREIALAPGSRFRGRVAAMVTSEAKAPGLNWDDMIVSDLGYVREVGNDHRFLGLWRFNIPTLHEYSQIISPAIYLLATRTLARPDAVQNMRNSYLLTYPSQRMLELFGARFAISDAPLNFGHELARSAQNNTHTQILTELPAANVRGFAVQRIEPINDATGFLTQLDRGADLRGVAFVAGAASKKGLSSATVDISVLPARIHVVGRSEGPAFVVLPIQYTRCLHVAEVAAGTKAPELQRADLALAGLAFDGAVDVMLAANLSLGHHAQCLIEDVAELRHLGLEQAARVFPPGALVRSQD